VVGCSVLLIGQVPRRGGDVELRCGQGDPDTYDKYMCMYNCYCEAVKGLGLGYDMHTAIFRSRRGGGLHA
jgi:hypothetical protein